MDNKTSELRAKLGAEKRMKHEVSMNSLGIDSASNTFTQRSRSVLPTLPPIQTNKDASSSRVLAFKTPNNRKASLALASPMNDPANKSIYKLEMSDPGRSMQGSFPGGKIKRKNNESPLGSQSKVKGRGNVKQLFESLNGGDREFVLDKIH